MKFKYLHIVSIVSLLAFGSCAQDVVETDGATQEQLDSSNKAKEALLYALPAYSKNFQTLGVLMLMIGVMVL